MTTTMIRACVFFCLCWFSRLTFGQNVAMTSSGSAIASNWGDNGLVLSVIDDTGNRQQFEITDFGGVSVFSSFDDVAIDPTNENLVFALSTQGLTVCSFLFGGTTKDSMQLVGCTGVFSVMPFSGVSAYGGTLIISGGTGGFTVYEYDRQTGLISDAPILLNQGFPNVVGHPDVVLVDSNLAALATHFYEGSSRFGTQMATIDLSGGSASLGMDYRVQNTLGFDLSVEPANFPLVNAIYKSSFSSTTIMYTANGPMQIQDLSSSQVAILAGAPSGFSAVAVAVNQARKLLVFGGVLASGGSQVLFYDLSIDPMNPTLLDSKPAGTNERITSIASGGDAVAFVTTTTNPGIIHFLDLPSGTAGRSDSSPWSDGNSSDASPANSSSTSPPVVQMSSRWKMITFISCTVLTMLILY